VTFENKIVVGLDDIKAVSFECMGRECHARVTLSLDKIRIPARCPNCNEIWISGGAKSFLSDTSQQTNFINALDKLRLLEANGVAFKILLEFDAAQIS